MYLVITHVCVFPFDTCWLIKSIRLSLFISFPQDWGLTSVTSGMAQALRERPILLDRTAFDFQHRGRFAWRKRRLCCWLCRLCSPVSCKKNKKALLVSLLHGGQETRGLLKQAECRCLWCGKKGMWKEQAQADEGMGGITSSLPTRQPWVLLLCWIECNRPKFFSLTTGACELTSSLPWERNCHDKANAFASFFFFFFYCPFLLLICVSVSSCPHFCLVCAFSLFASFILSFSLCITHGDIIFPLSKW